MALTNQKNTKSNLPFGIKPLTSFQKRLYIFIFLNILIIISSFIFISKTSDQIRKTTDLIVASKDNQVNANTLMEYIAKLEKESKLVEEDFSKYDALLVDLDNLPNIKKQIVNIGIKNKVDPLLNILTLNPAKEKEPISYGYVLSMNGAFNNIIKTFKDINELKILITFDQVTFEKNIPKSTTKTTVALTDDSTTTKSTIKRTTTTKPTDIFKVSIIGKIYLKENLKTQNNESTK